MKTSDLLDLIGDDGITQRVYSRRSVLKGSAASTAALVLAGMPFGLAALATEAHAQTAAPSAAGLAALQLALKLEYLEADFYNMGVTAFASTFTQPEKDAIGQLAKHENAHVALLKGALGSSAPANVTHDYTGGGGAGTGPFPNVFKDKVEFLKLAQLFEDTGVRAYKGQAGNLIADKLFLTTALRIHSVEARHAAKIRRLRGQIAYITQAQFDAAYTTTKAASGASQADLATGVYNSTPVTEANTTERGVNVVGLNGATADRVTEAFDEPLDTASVVAIAGFFGVK